MRVIAGSARGRPIHAPKNSELRPTGDLVKGVIFSMLEAEAYKRGFEPDEEGNMAAALAWPRVVDLFAGTGALGIEALSRGAQHADFVEQDRDAARTIATNLRGTGLDASNATVHASSVQGAAARVRGPVDLVFADPPYDDAQALRAVTDFFSRAAPLADGGVFVLEQRASSEPPEIPGLSVLRTRTHGQTRVTLYAKSE